MLFYREKPCKIHFFKKPFDQFAKELRKRYEENTETSAHTPIPAPEQADKPRVFICHASEDKHHAASLYEKLADAGLQPWLDKKKLRGGTQWDEHIMRTIKRDIDYFLVLQSKALESKDVGYVNKEIYEARERQKTFRFGTRFIIPLRIEDCGILPELDHLQTIDLDTEEKTGELIKIINSDYFKRSKK